MYHFKRSALNYFSQLAYHLHCAKGLQKKEKVYVKNHEAI